MVQFKPVQLAFMRICMLSLLFLACKSQHRTVLAGGQSTQNPLQTPSEKSRLPKMIKVLDNIAIGNYFKYIDSLVIAYDSVVPYPLSEHLLVWNNPWIIDTLVNTDYYRMIKRDSFVYDQRQLIALPQGSTLKLPDALEASNILADMESAWIDLNIPEFKLRIYQDSVLLYTFPVRVGQNRERYLKMGDRVTKLRTISGEGLIVRHVRNPDFYDPVTYQRFYITKRDDNRSTLMPQIPWIETKVNGLRNGQMIHPTTNPKTLRKASSNGCIGTKESDAWRIYYHAPIGTPLVIRYDLKVSDSLGNEKVLKDIYGSKASTD